jgi:hypothetical protein
MKRTLLALALAVGAFGSLPGAASAGEINNVYVVAPSAHVCFPLPAVQLPIHVMISALRPGGTQTPSELIEAIINQDALSTQMTWIGTNSDGTQTGSSSLATPVIAKLWAAPLPHIFAELRVCSPLANHQIGIYQNAPPVTGGATKYFVTMFF